MKAFLELTRERDGERVLANLDHIQRVIPAAKGSLVCWSNGDEPTQVRDSYEDIHERIGRLIEG